MNSEMGYMLLVINTTFLIIVIFVGSNKHFKILYFAILGKRFQQVFYFSDLRKHFDHLAKDLLVYLQI